MASPLWSVMANIIHLPNDVLVASSGRPGIGAEPASFVNFLNVCPEPVLAISSFFMITQYGTQVTQNSIVSAAGLWVSADGLGEEWEFHNIAAIHNGLLPRPSPIVRNGSSAMGYHPTLANISGCSFQSESGSGSSAMKGGEFVICHSCSDPSQVYWLSSNRTLHLVAHCDLCGRNLCVKLTVITESQRRSYTSGAEFACGMAGMVAEGICKDVTPPQTTGYTVSQASPQLED